MDTRHYQAKHDSLCILAKAAQAVALNRRAARLTRPTDPQQKHMATLLLKGFHTESAQCCAPQLCRNNRHVQPATTSLVCLFSLTCKVSSSNLQAAVNQTLTVSSR